MSVNINKLLGFLEIIFKALYNRELTPDKAMDEARKVFGKKRSRQKIQQEKKKVWKEEE